MRVSARLIFALVLLVLAVIAEAAVLIYSDAFLTVNLVPGFIVIVIAVLSFRSTNMPPGFWGELAALVLLVFIGTVLLTNAVATGGTRLIAQEAVFIGPMASLAFWFVYRLIKWGPLAFSSEWRRNAPIGNVRISPSVMATLAFLYIGPMVMYEAWSTAVFGFTMRTVPLVGLLVFLVLWIVYRLIKSGPSQL